MMLSVKPIAHISPKVPTMDTGMAIAAMIVLLQLPRNIGLLSV